ncbi:MAG: hypothetical protein GQ569_13415 [Methylococcaceae bacterium]|nr:hypothetical protein [Methylococcaceae bacterium]
MNINQLQNMLTTLCNANPQKLAAWLDEDKFVIQNCLLLLILCSSFYGASLGLWRDPLQSFYVAVKFPLLILLTCSCNAVINGMLAQLLGAPISFRQSFLSVIISFTLLAVILASLTPLILFLLYNLPAMASASAKEAHGIFLLTNVVVISFAGVIANLRLFALLEYLCADRIKAMQILISWLAANLFLGCQLSWNLRPFFGSPHLDVSFVRDDPFDSSFYESVFTILMNYLGD